MKDWSNVRCCICGEPLWNGRENIPEYMKKEYFGNNPWPISINEDDRCCDFCNNEIVIPTRVAQLFR